MHALTMLEALRTEITHAEHITTQAWEQYAQVRSNTALHQAVDATRQTITLHRQLAQRLEQLVSLPEATDREHSTDVTTPLAPCAA